MRPLVIIGGYLTSPNDFAPLAQLLSTSPYGYQTFIAPISRTRWLITRDWDFRKVIAIVRATVEQALSASGAEQVDILAHSVGGMVARMYMGEQPYKGEVYGGHRYVRRLTMLGTPHHSQEHWTRQSVGFVNSTYPGAFYPEVRYTSVVGRAIQGNPRGTLIERMSSTSYSTVSGPSFLEAWGDGISTLECAALSGAEYLAVQGVSHSPFHGRPWYGDQEGLALWGKVLR
ncbi:alpha/beta fold hydrolase [Oscillochloris sp. ZM17-4]|uniref:esterase/lipase family protein n=1 Tax=Oscillochloris sp. ZM17-4 TaxID=2866714 RepID=UPI001C72FC47|nr:alpha/beta fold hydrolase [Oscillochloris sp. ZM17-4]MBX0330791.1 alpha/beta fold hydrolase [Oscillochloris sp. ZM17-4]